MLSFHEQFLVWFKSGMVLIALKAQKPIIPVYIKPREHWYDRLVLSVGEPVNVTQGGGVSTIEETAKMLRTKEELLKDIVGGKRT